MAHYDVDVHCKICGEYLGTYNMMTDPKPPEEHLVCQDKDNCEKRKQGKLEIRYW